MTVRKKGERIAPSINMNEFFRMYSDGAGMAVIMKSIADCILTVPPFGEDLASDIQDYEKAKEKMFIRVSSMDTNSEYLEKIPYMSVFDDMAVTCHVIIDKGDDYTGSVTVTSELLKAYGIGKKELFEAAYESSAKNMPPVIYPIEAMLDKMMGIPVELPDGDFAEQVDTIVDSGSMMYVLSNSDTTQGASVIMYPGVLQTIGDKIGNFYILPSSIHEILVISEKRVSENGMNVGDLSAMVNEVNNSEVRPEERLSYTVLYYDSDTNTLKLADGETVTAASAIAK